MIFFNAISIRHPMDRRNLVRDPFPLKPFFYGIIHQKMKNVPKKLLFNNFFIIQ
jgi:hypothetical protein